MSGSKLLLLYSGGHSTLEKNPYDQPVYSKISIQEAENMANRGVKAAVILSKAFPQTNIELFNQETNKQAQRPPNNDRPLF